MEHSRLNHVDLTQSFKRKEYERLLAARQQEFVALRLRLGGQIGGKIRALPSSFFSKVGTRPARAAVSGG